MFVLACFQYRMAASCQAEGESCHQCYQTLESYLLNTSDNKYQLRRVFYPLEVADPVFVTVTYQYIGTNTTNLWFWTEGIFYFLQPIEVFQFTSLFFGNPSWRSSTLNITLPSECINASNDFMTELTQMVRKMHEWLQCGIHLHFNSALRIICRIFEKWGYMPFHFLLNRGSPAVWFTFQTV